jgi:protocatechuate 3,4-dioxygenase beta subunit
MDEITRRRMLALGVALPLTLGACGSDSDEDDGAAAATGTAAPDADAGVRLAATPACDDGDDEPTPEQTEGPYFTPDSPRRRDLVEAGMAGRRLSVTGFVLGTDCRPVPRALLDFWQADAAGEYDNEGYRLRGHQLTDSRGRFRLQTVLPGLYPGRTRHIHVKVQRPRGEVLTTQLYFPGEPRNAGDGIFDDALLMRVRRGPQGWAGRFSFVVV